MSGNDHDPAESMFLNAAGIPATPVHAQMPPGVTPIVKATRWSQPADHRTEAFAC
jgi:hypothetical protein